MEITISRSTYSKYAAYKDSGVEWLGEIPEGWEANRLKSKINLQTGFPFKSEKYTYMGIKLARGINVKEGYFDWSEVRHWPEVSKELESFLLKEGDVLIAMDGSKVGKNFCQVKKVDLPILLLQRVARLRTKSELIPNYLYWTIANKSFLSWVNISKTDPMVPHIAPKDINNFVIAIPPLPEQTAIANFLDDKTAKIDQAIAQKEKLIALLKERKQIIIQNAVTKGLDPNVKLKDSEVEWIGEIPEHWEVKRLKYILKEPLKYGANESGIEYDPNLPRYIRITDFSGVGQLNEEKKLSLPTNIGLEYLLEDGDILFARSGATVGKSYQFRKSLSVENSYCFAGYLIKASPNERLILSDFLNWYTASGSFENWKNQIFNKATIENIGADKYSQLLVPCPSILEQSKINEFIKSQSSNIEQTIALQQTQIEKLKEYKATLIDSAVTGKIKVS